MQATQTQILSEIIGMIYDAAEDPHAWPALLGAFAQLLEEQHDNNSLSSASVPIQSIVERWQSDIDAADSIVDGLIATHRFSSEEVVLIETLAPHFNRALRLHRQAERNRAREQLSTEIFDRLPIGVALVDRNRQLIYTNSHFHRVAPELAGEPTQGRRWKRLLESPGNQVEQLSLVDGRPRSLFAMPLADSGEMAVFVAAPSGFSLNVDALMTLFGLTKTEARLAQVLSQGLSLDEIAKQGNVSINTVRTQVKTLLAKTETNRQGALIAKLLASPAAFAGAGTLNTEQTAQLTAPPPRFLAIDKRRIAYSDLGPNDGVPILWMHGLIGSRLQHHPSLDALEQLGLRLILLERPGVGRSTPCPDRTLAEWAHDVERCADRLGLERFMVGGYSMGAMYALACARWLERRVSNLVLISPFQAPEQLSDMRGMVVRSRMFLMLARYVPALLPPVVNMIIQGIRSRPDDFLSQLIDQIPADDASVLSDPAVRAQYIMSLSESISVTERGVLQELLKAVQPWGFEPHEIKQPCMIWHGDEDRHVPLALAERLATRLPHSELHSVPGGGHFLLYHRWNEILTAIRNWEHCIEYSNDNRPHRLNPAVVDFK